ncbi:unnamed protein product, partial [Discosporangium mesarthrocarpum]
SFGLSGCTLSESDAQHPSLPARRCLTFSPFLTPKSATMAFKVRGSPSAVYAMLTASAITTVGVSWSGYLNGPSTLHRHGGVSHARGKELSSSAARGSVLGASDEGNSSGMASSKPLVVCGPSGAGKGTLIDKLMGEYPGQFGFSVSHTTRKPRPGEVHGKHYYFSEKATMQAEIDDNKFIEHANVHGNLYGTSIASVGQVRAGGKVCILDIDVQGVKSVRAAGREQIDPNYLFVAPPSMEKLEARLRGRGTETDEQIQKRLGNAMAEMEYGTEPGNFNKILVNDDLEVAYRDLVVTVEGWYPQLA